MVNDPLTPLATRYLDLIMEAEQERLIAQLPRRNSSARLALAVLCRRLAEWIDDSGRYVRASEAGPVDWASHSTSV